MEHVIMFKASVRAEAGIVGVSLALIDVTVESRNQSLYRLLKNSNFAALIISDL